MTYAKITLTLSFAALAIALLITGNVGSRVFLQFTICAAIAFIVLHALRTRAEYRWAGILGGIVLMVLAAQGSFVVGLISVALFVVYYTRCIAAPGFPAVSVANRRRY
jgi:hypothetical protein